MYGEVELSAELLGLREYLAVYLKNALFYYYLFHVMVVCVVLNQIGDSLQSDLHYAEHTLLAP